MKGTECSLRHIGIVISITDTKSAAAARQQINAPTRGCLTLRWLARAPSSGVARSAKTTRRKGLHGIVVLPVQWMRGRYNAFYFFRIFWMSASDTYHGLRAWNPPLPSPRESPSEKCDRSPIPWPSMHYIVFSCCCRPSLEPGIGRIR